MSIPTPASITRTNRRLEHRRAAVFHVLRRMHAGGLFLQAQHVKNRRIWNLSNGDPIPTEIAELVIQRPEVINGCDGLFPGATSQTYRLK